MQLKDHTQHRNLAFYLDGFDFHGKTLAAQLANFDFAYIEDLYTPSPIECSECEHYLKHLDDYLLAIQVNAVENAIKNVNIHKVARCKAITLETTKKVNGI